MSVVALNNLQDITITTKGKEILGKIISGEDYTIYKAKIGTGTLPSTEKEEDQTDLITEYKEIAISNVTVLDSGGYQIEVVYDNLGVTALTDITELGIYMADASNGETLYAYSYSATPLVLIPESKGVVEITNRINVYLVDGDTVNAHIDRTGTYVTIEDLEQKLKLKMDVSAAGSGFGLHKSDAIDSDDSDTVATSKAVHDVNVKVDADKKILTSTTTTANNAVANAKTALDTANTKMTQTQGDARYPLIADDWKDTNAKSLDCTTISDPDTWAKTAEYGEYRLRNYNSTWSLNNKWPDVSGSDARLHVIQVHSTNAYRRIEIVGYNTNNANMSRVLYNNVWTSWATYYTSLIKPTATDVGLGSVHNYGITDSTTANSSSTYASSKAVTTVHNEAHAASTAAVKAQTTANSAVPKTDVYSGGGTGYASVVNKIPKVGTDGVIELGRYIDMHQVGDTLAYNTRLGSETDKSFSVSNANGYIQIGPKNSSYCHMYTDRPSFYFNKELIVNNHKVYNEGFKPPITDSTTANNSSIYASSKAVTTVHNEAHAAQVTANAANAKLVSEGRQDNGTFKANTKLKSGFYRPGAGADVSNYQSMIVADNSDTGLQIVGGHTYDHLQFRGWHEHGKTFTPWRTVYHDGHKPSATDVGLGSVHNYGITDSTTANSSSTYASSKAVTTVHNEAVKALGAYNPNNRIEFTVAGDANTYYPVVIDAHHVEYSLKRFSINRGYNWTAPGSVWNPGQPDHQGGLTLDLLWTGDSSWGGNDHSLHTIRFSEDYTTMVAGAGVTRGSLLVVWLRGGTAKYCLVSDTGSNATVTPHYTTFTDNGQIFSPTTDHNAHRSSLYNDLPNTECPYRVGDILHTVYEANPATRWIGTAWTKIEGRVLIGANSTYPNTHTGGASSIHLSGGHIPSHSHSVSINTNSTGNHTHTVASHAHSQPAHTHTVTTFGRYGRDRGRYEPAWSYGNTGIGNDNHISTVSSKDTTSGGNQTTGASAPGTNTVGDHAHTVHGNTGAYGSASAFNIMNPWYAVNIWRRTS